MIYNNTPKETNKNTIGYRRYIEERRRDEVSHMRREVTG